MLLANCEKKEPLEDLQQASVETVGVNEAIAVINASNPMISNRTAEEPFVTLDLENIYQEQLLNSNESMAIIPATNRYENVYSRIILLKLNGQIEHMVFSMVEDLESETAEFSGKIYMTTLDGDYLDGYKVVDGVAVIRYKKAADRLPDDVQARMAEEECYGMTCGLELDEIVINAEGGGGSNGVGSITIVITGSGSWLGFGNSGFPTGSAAGWDYSSTGGGGGNSGYNGGNEKEVWDCGGSKVYNPRTKVCECPAGMVDNGYECVLKEVEIKNNLTGKARCVYEKLQNNSILQKTIEKFKGKTPTNLIINQKSNLRVDDTNPNSSIVNGKTYYGNSYNITITINTEQANNRPSLAVARTILHEAIHADIFRKIKTTSGLVYDNSVWKLPDGSRSNFPSLFDAYNEDPNNPYHNYMAKYYREALEYGLKEYAGLIGENHSDQFYKDLAWAGLLDTKSWKNQYADITYSNKESVRIKNVIINYENSKKNDCL